jgi:hypothetical protein
MVPQVRAGTARFRDITGGACHIFPVFVYHGTGDEIIPIAVSDYCAKGAKLLGLPAIGNC